MKKYMNPHLVRPPNAGLESHNRAALQALADNATASAIPQKKTSPRKPTQHTAHGLHGPAHATASRTQASAIAPSTHGAPVKEGRKMDLGTYDGGFERDVADAEDVTGEAAKVLELQSAAGG
jgi:aurora kinase